MIKVSKLVLITAPGVRPQFVEHKVYSIVDKLCHVKD